MLCQEVDELKENARRKLERASKESGVSKPEELKAAFNLLPNRLEEIEDQIHELRAQAEACVGTDQSVGVVAEKLVYRIPGPCKKCLC